MNGNSQNGRSLPDGWEWMTVANSVKNISLTGKKLPQRDYLEAGKFPVIDQGQKFVGGYSDSEELIVKCDPPVIVFGDHTKAIKFIPMPFVAGADGIKVLKPLEHFNPKLLYYFLQAVELPDKGYARHFQYLEKAEIPVPPLHEQEQIVRRIEELFSDLEVGMATLERVHVGLKRYKTSVLKTAFEGKLLPSGKVETNDGALEGWRFVKFDELLPNGLANGLYKSSEFTSEEGIRIIDIKGLYKGFDADFSNCRSFRLTANEIERYSLQEGDILVNRVSKAADGVGKSALVRHLDKPTVYESNMMLARLSTEVYPPYINYFLNSDSGRKQTLLKAKTTQQSSVNQGDIKSIIIPLPPLDEQRRIVAEVERRLSVVGEVESAVEVGLVRAGRLRQSVLRSAFEGRL